MKKFKAVIAALTTSNTSEFWMAWGSVIATTLVKFVPGVAAVIDTISGFLNLEPENLLAAAIMYVVGRVTKKAVTA